MAKVATDRFHVVRAPFLDRLDPHRILRHVKPRSGAIGDWRAAGRGKDQTIAAIPAMTVHISKDAAPTIKMPAPGGRGRSLREWPTATWFIDRTLIPIAPAEARLLVMTTLRFTFNREDDKDWLRAAEPFYLLRVLRRNTRPPV